MKVLLLLKQYVDPFSCMDVFLANNIFNSFFGNYVTQLVKLVIYCKDMLAGSFSAYFTIC